MNERIRLLAEQAGHRYIPSSNSGPLRVEYLTPEIEKFAELIVRQCAEICLEANDHKNILRYYGYFGVEE